MTAVRRLDFQERHRLYEWLIYQNKEGSLRGLSRADAAELFSAETGIAGVNMGHIASIIRDAELQINWKQKATITRGAVQQLRDRMERLEAQVLNLSREHDSLRDHVHKPAPFRIAFEDVENI